MTTTLTQAIVDFIAQRKEAKLEPHKKALQKILDNSESNIEIAEAKVAYEKLAQPIEEKYKPQTWLTDAAKRAKQINFATHPPKYTHGDSKSSGVMLAAVSGNETEYLVTQSLSDPLVDVYGNSAALDVAGLLQLEVQGESLLSELKNGHLASLSQLAGDNELLASWVQGFSLALSDEAIQSHTLSKQLYFPVTLNANSNAYHLLCPLFSSSMAEVLHQKVTNIRFGDSKEIRDARKKEIFHPAIDESLLNTAVQKFGGANQQNTSQQNNRRNGTGYLLNCAPPTWQAQTKPPLYLQSLFSRPINVKANNLIREFKVFLSNLKDHEKNFKTRYKRDHSFVVPIIDVVFDYAVTLQNLTAFAGWTDDSKCKLKPAQALWLDIANPRKSFQQEREKGDWIKEVAHDFASWLNIRLKSDTYKMADIEHGYFAKMFNERLKRFERTAIMPEHAITKIGDQ